MARTEVTTIPWDRLRLKVQKLHTDRLMSTHKPKKRFSRRIQRYSSLIFFEYDCLLNINGNLYSQDYIQIVQDLQFLDPRISKLIPYLKYASLYRLGNPLKEC